MCEIGCKDELPSLFMNEWWSPVIQPSNEQLAPALLCSSAATRGHYTWKRGGKSGAHSGDSLQQLQPRIARALRAHTETNKERPVVVWVCFFLFFFLNNRSPCRWKTPWPWRDAWIWPRSSAWSGGTVPPWLWLLLRWCPCWRVSSSTGTWEGSGGRPQPQPQPMTASAKERRETHRWSSRARRCLLRKVQSFSDT